MVIPKYLSRVTSPPYRKPAFQAALNSSRTWWFKLKQMASTDALAPWHAAYPPPRNKTPAVIMRQDVLEMIKNSNNIAGRNYVLVDLRRTDHEVSSQRVVSRAATNLPFLPSRAVRFAGLLIYRHRASTPPYRRYTACLKRLEYTKSSGTAVRLELLSPKTSSTQYRHRHINSFQHPPEAEVLGQLDGSKTISTTKATAIWRA